MAKKKSTGAVSAPYPSEEDWRARDDMRTLGSAREIEADKKRLSAAQREARKEQAKLQSVLGKQPKPLRGQRAGSHRQKLTNKRI